MYKLEIERLDGGVLSVTGTKKPGESSFDIATAIASDLRTLAEKEDSPRKGAEMALSVISQMLYLLDDNIIPHIDLAELKRGADDLRHKVN